MDLNQLLKPNKICTVGASERTGFGGDTCPNILTYMDPSRDYIGYLLKQKAAGRIRYLGFSSHAAPAGLKQFRKLREQGL